MQEAGVQRAQVFIAERGISNEFGQPPDTDHGGRLRPSTMNSLAVRLCERAVSHAVKTMYGATITTMMAISTCTSVLMPQLLGHTAGIVPVASGT
ncbi:hypothetical protein SAMN05216517_1205 [Janthinobacterium sp. OK676]|nr:hypothetical protein CLU90_0611 [Janthinobacterium sp. 67]SDO23246.1 hypothetical protein SAMN05216517_1205 [Janthinobacterium sp. OK676]